MAEAEITRQRIDELLGFLPALAKPESDIEPQWDHPDENSADDVRFFPCPTYPLAVAEFFRLAGQEWWVDRDYEPSAAGKLVEDDAAIATSSLDQIKTMLTFCVRGERFCDGHWAAMIREGRITAILRRLAELRNTVT